ncbi:uroporphyrinogen decarboxylase family protein [Desulforhopalus sp. 52FAK]
MQAKMTNRERILAALSHEQPDMVPLDMGGSVDSSITVAGYEKLKDHFGVKVENNISHVMMQVVEPDETILKKLDIDTRSVLPGPLPGGRFVDESVHIDPWGIERVKPVGGHYFDQMKYPLSGPLTIKEISNYPWPDPDQPELIEPLKRRIQWIRENTDCATVLNIPAPFVHISQYLRGFQDWYMDMVRDPPLLEALFDAVNDVTMQITRNLLKEVGQDVDIIFNSDDLGAQRGLQFSRDHYLKFIQPRHKQFFDLVKSMSPAKIVFHSCGAITSILDDLVDMGIDCINPVQTSATGMEPLELKKKWGDKLAFWGGVDSVNILPKGSPADVKKTVEQLVEELGEGGGYVLGSVHNIQPDVPVENILTMFQHAREYVPSYLK